MTAAVAPVASAPEASVRSFGRYLLGRSIGAGGMAFVHAAIQQGAGGAGRVVAVKVLRAAATDDFRKLFLREAVIATRLEHPNIIRTYEVGELDGELFIAMELVVGASLSQLRAQRMPIAFAVRIMSDVLRGLHAAHELRNADGLALGLVHQDVTPQNIIVGRDGITKLLDFGVARLNAVDSSHTDTVRGKPSYLAPEQLEGTRLDRKVDVFAVGIVLHEMLTGARVFARETVAQTYAAVLKSEVPDIKALRPEVPQPIIDVVLRALSRNQDARYESAEAMRLALAAAAVAGGIPLATNEGIAAWIDQVHPAPFTTEGLEREILDADRATPAPRERVTVPESTVRSEVPLFPGRPIDMRRLYRIRAAGVLSIVVMGVITWLALTGRIGAKPVVAVVPSASASAVVIPAAPSVPSAQPEPEPIASAAPSASSSASARRPLRNSPRAPAAAPSAVAAPVVTPSAAPAPLASSHLYVSSSPYGDVYVDGNNLGNSPIVDRQIAPGLHEVTVITKDGKKQTQRPNLAPGGDTRLKFDFE